MDRALTPLLAALLLAATPAASQRWVPRVEVTGMAGRARHVESFYPPDDTVQKSGGHGLFLRVDALVRWRYFGFRGAELIATNLHEVSPRFENPELGYREGQVLLGPRALAMSVGFGQRRMCDDTVDNPCWEWRYTTIGAESRVPLGTSGLAAEVGIRYYSRIREVDLDGKWSGVVLDSRLQYRPNLPDLPVFLVASYRYESFSATLSEAEDGFDEDASGLFLGIGVEFP